MLFRGNILDKRWMLALLVVVAAVPLLWPPIPPLIDVLGHMGRYRIQTAIDHVPSLAASYSFEWKLVGNLGVDLLIVPMAKLFGIELATKLIVIAVPPLTALGMLWTAREAHGRIPPTVLFALPLAYSFPFHFGFINFSLSVALAFNLLALWIRLGRTGRLKLRAAIFIPLSSLLWLAHMVGWGLLGLSAFGSEWVRLRRSGKAPFRAAINSAIACLALALPLLPMVLLRSDAPEAVTFDWFNWQAKALWISSLLRDRWAYFDLVSAWLLILVVALAVVGRRIEPVLGMPALICLVAFILMPRVAEGSAYADMRLLPFTCALALLSIRSSGRWIAMLALLFFLVRIGANTVSLALYDRTYRSELQALDHLPRGASVLALVVRPCGNEWSTERLDHMPGLAIERRDAFANDQWIIGSAQGLKVIKEGLGHYDRDPSQLVYPEECRGEGSSLEEAVEEFSRTGFDHVWIINGSANATDLRPVWSNGHSTLYQVIRERKSG